MTQESARSSLFAVLLFCLLPAISSAAAALPTLEQARLSSPTGSAQTILHIPLVGRYSLTAESPTGATLEIVDRMMGAMATARSDAASADSSGRMARVDAFLEPGEYKVRVVHARGETVSLRVERFTSGNAGADSTAAPLLANGDTSIGELHDRELFSYWILVDADTPTLLVEARGRRRSVRCGRG